MQGILEKKLARNRPSLKEPATPAEASASARLKSSRKSFFTPATLTVLRRTRKLGFVSTGRDNWTLRFLKTLAEACQDLYCGDLKRFSSVMRSKSGSVE